MTCVSIHYARLLPIALPVTFALSGCADSASSGSNSPTGGASPSIEATVECSSPEIEALDFSTPAVKSRFCCFDKAATEFCSSAFQRQPYGQHGMFFRTSWAKECDFGNWLEFTSPRAKWKDMHRVVVSTDTIPFPKAVIAELTADYVPADPDKWSVYYYFRENEENCVWGIVLFRWDDLQYGGPGRFRPFDHSRQRVDLQPRYSDLDYEAIAQSKSLMEKSFLRNYHSAESLRDKYVTDMAALELKKVASIESHKEVKELPPTSQNGIPQFYPPVPLTCTF